MTRPSKDEYFMSIATRVAARATCPRASVGAVLVSDGHILSTGYNGSPKGLVHCTDPEEFWFCHVCGLKQDSPPIEISRRPGTHFSRDVRTCAGQMKEAHGGCEMEHGHCIRVVHSEANALIQAASVGHQTAGTTLYTTHSCCRACMHLAINAGVTRIVYAKRYGDPTHIGDRAAWSLETAKKLGIEMSFFEPS